VPGLTFNAERNADSYSEVSSKKERGKTEELVSRTLKKNAWKRIGLEKM